MSPRFAERFAGWHGRVVVVGLSDRLAEIGRVGAMCALRCGRWARDHHGGRSCGAGRVSVRDCWCVEVYCHAARGRSIPPSGCASMPSGAPIS